MKCGKHTILYALLVIMLAALAPQALSAAPRYLKDKVPNRPYTDLRAWHLGFSVGTHFQDLQFTHNGFITDDGEQWLVEQPSYSPGFCVSALASLRLSRFFSLRFSPGLYFGSRSLRMIDHATGNTERQNLKSTYLVLPLDLKYSAVRLGNFRPYMLAGVMPAFDVNKKTSDLLQLNTADMYLSVGFGADFYLPYFKLIPELKFCFGLCDVLRHNRPDLAEDPQRLKFTQSLKKAMSNMVVLTFYFE